MATISIDNMADALNYLRLEQKHKTKLYREFSDEGKQTLARAYEKQSLWLTIAIDALESKIRKCEPRSVRDQHLDDFMRTLDRR